MSYLNSNRKRNSLKKILAGIFCAAFLCVPFVAARAATLSVSPAAGSYTVGSTFKARIVVGSGGVSVNAVSGVLKFPADKLTLTGLSKTGSVITLWVQEPSISNAQGTASFEGVMLNGYSGAGGTVLTATFRAKAEGSATVALSSDSAVLLNDGQGTNGTTGVGSATYTITPPQTKPTTPTPKPTDEVPPVVEPVPEEETFGTIPKIIEYAPVSLENNFLVAKGSADPFEEVVLILNKKDMSAAATRVTADESGLFTYVSPQKMPEGVYVVTPARIKNDGTYELGSPVTITLRDDWWLQFGDKLQRFISIKISLGGLLLILLCVALVITMWSRMKRKPQAAQ